MQTKKLSATIGAAAVLLAGNAAAAQYQDNAPGGSATQKMQKAGPSERSEAREEMKDREREMEHAPGKGERMATRDENTERAREMAENQGSQTSREMQERREERKEIQEEYRKTRGEGEKAKKKPWWKFWGSDSDS